MSILRRGADHRFLWSATVGSATQEPLKWPGRVEKAMGAGARTTLSGSRQAPENVQIIEAALGLLLRPLLLVRSADRPVIAEAACSGRRSGGKESARHRVVDNREYLSRPPPG